MMDGLQRSFISLKRERDTAPQEELTVVVPDKQSTSLDSLCDSIKRIRLDGGTQENPGLVFVVLAALT